jgi:predicted membrane-bound mannosyltransferase
MTPTLDDLLKDTGENDPIDDNAQTPSPADLERLANEPATMLWCLRLVQRSSAHCWVKKWVRAMRITLAVALGILVAAQVGGYFALKAAFHDATRSAVIEVLKEHKLIAATSAASEGAVVAEDIALAVIRGGKQP